MIKLHCWLLQALDGALRAQGIILLNKSNQKVTHDVYPKVVEKDVIQEHHIEGLLCSIAGEDMFNTTEIVNCLCIHLCTYVVFAFNYFPDFCTFAHYYAFFVQLFIWTTKQ